MGNGNQIKFMEAEILLSQQRKKFYCIIALIAAVGTAFLISTTVLALQLQRGYPSARVEFHVWDDHEPNSANKNFLTIKVPQNATLFTTMEHAANEAYHFRFGYKQYEFGKYIQSIGGIKENVQENRSWILYKLNDSPDVNNPPTKESIPDGLGIDDVRVEDGDVYLFWLTQPSLTSPLNNNLKTLGALSPPCINGSVA